MQYEILHRPSYALAQIQLASGEQLQAEAGAMVSMSASVSIETGMRGGLLGGLKRSVLGGESFFINTFTAEQSGEVTIAPGLPGDIQAIEMTGNPVLVQSGSFLAATTDIEVDTSWSGKSGFFSGEGLILLRCTGHGLLFLSSYGAIHLKELNIGEQYTVDTGHMVAFDDSVKYSVGRSGGWKTTLLSGEGLVCKLEGPGRFYMQTRSQDAFLNWLLPHIPKQ